jgi:hypothetical protein
MRFSHSHQASLPPSSFCLAHLPFLTSPLLLRDAFEWSWMRFSSVKNICNLCQRYFCNNCACASVNVNFSSPSPSPSPSPSEISGTKDVLACNHCAEVLQSYYRRLAFQKERRVAELNPIVNYYRDTKNMKAQVMLLLDRYTDIISALSCIDAGRCTSILFLHHSQCSPLVLFRVVFLLFLYCFTLVISSCSLQTAKIPLHFRQLSQQHQIPQPCFPLQVEQQ